MCVIYSPQVCVKIDHYPGIVKDLVFPMRLMNSNSLSSINKIVIDRTSNASKSNGDDRNVNRFLVNVMTF